MRRRVFLKEFPNVEKLAAGIKSWLIHTQKKKKEVKILEFEVSPPLCINMYSYFLTWGYVAAVDVYRSALQLRSLTLTQDRHNARRQLAFEMRDKQTALNLIKTMVLPLGRDYSQRQRLEPEGGHRNHLISLLVTQPCCPDWAGPLHRKTSGVI